MIFRRSWLVWLLILLHTAGCLSPRKPASPFATMPAPVSLTRIEYPDADAPTDPHLISDQRPHTLRDMNNVQYWELRLDEAIRLALENSRVLRDLGGAVVRAPDTSVSSLDPSIQETDPRFGVEGALSAFDAQLRSTLTAESVDRRLNNQFVGDRGFLFGHNQNFNTELTKRGATGTQYSLRQKVGQEADSNLGNQFPSGAWNVLYEAEARHPLLQGGGTQFNRIAGPGATSGVYNGVLIARIRTDISLADFEIALRDFVSNVENTYWDLYFSYRDLDAKRKARDSALESWRRIHALYETGRRGGEAEREAQAREQYFRFEADLQDALAGRPLDGTRTNNGSRPGTFRGLPGVLVNERRLRLLMNVNVNDQMLIRPSDEPTQVPMVYDWSALSSEAIARRSELRRQRWQVQRREMELLASRNFLMPQLDIVGQYRVRGFGDDLINAGRGQPRFDNAFADLTTGDFQEWNAGLEFSMPVGYRQAYAGVRNAELRLARERVVLDAQEREILYDLSTAIGEADRSFFVMQTNYNRWVAARQQVAAVEAAYNDDRVEFIAVLDAQRRYAEAESQHFRSRVEYAMAVKNISFERGALLDYYGIACTEGPWNGKAYDDAQRREENRGRPLINHAPTPIVGTDPS